MQQLTTRPSWMPKYVPRAGCVLWYPGQDDPQSAVIRDRSGNGNNGTIVGATWARAGRGLWYLYFDGNDRVSAALSSTLKMADGDFTMSIWFNSPAQTTNVQGLLHGGGAGAGGKRYSLYLDDSDVNADSLQIQLDDNANPTFVVVAYTGWGTWTKLDAVRDGNVFRSYLNGAASTTGDCTATGSVDSPNDRPLDFGAESDEGDGAYSNYLTGSLALPRVIKGVAKSATQILGEYSQERFLFGV